METGGLTASRTSLWKLSVTCAPELAAAVEALLEDGAAAVTVMAPPRSSRAEVEALYAEKPAKTALTALHAKLAVLTALHHAGTPSPEKTGALLAQSRVFSSSPPMGEREKRDAYRVKIEEIRNLDWLKKVAADFPPLKIARWTIYGGAHAAKVSSRLKLRIDASSAFGTGEHPTTRGCLMMLDRVLKKSIRYSSIRHARTVSLHGAGSRGHPSPGKRSSLNGGRWTPAFAGVTHTTMLDIGCGSGILAMAYAKATGRPAVAVDCDRQAVSIARENVRQNKLAALVTVAKGDGYAAREVRKNAPYGLVMANIFAGPLCRMAGDLKRSLAPGGLAILSGILNHQADAVIAAHRARGMVLSERLRQDEWTVLVLQNPA